LADRDLLEKKLAACEMEPALVSLLVDSNRQKYPTQKIDSILGYTDNESFRRSTLATLYDENAAFSLSGDRITLDSMLQYRYVTSRVDYGTNSVRFGDCLSKSANGDVERIASLESIVNRHVEGIVSNIPAVRNVRDYGRIAAFLRWAHQPSHLLAVDFYSLARVAGHDARQTPTPDFITH
jgi:hypothetical protein